MIALRLLLIISIVASGKVVNGQSGKLLGEEHFNENENGWNLGEDNNVVRKIEGGKLILECKKYLASGGGYWIRMPDVKLPDNNYSVSVTTHWIKNVRTDDSFNPYGIILGDYYFLIYGDGEKRMLKYNKEEKKYEVIVDWGTNAAIKKRDTGDNKLEVVYKDGKAAFYANGQMLFKKEASIPVGTYVKLYVENSEMVGFDDLIVTAN